MGSAQSYETKAGRMWRACWTDPSNDRKQKRGFKTKREARAFADQQEVSKHQGLYVSQSDGKATIGQLGAEWLAAHQAAVKASTFQSDASAWRVHVLPIWGTRAVSSIRHTEIRTWVAGLSKSKSATTVKRAHGILAAILEAAVRDRRTTSNPARDVPLPRKSQPRRVYLTHQQVERLATAAKYGDLVRFLAYTGLRWGEATGLRLIHVDTVRRRVFVDENAVDVNGSIVVGTPKSHERRSVPYPSFLEAAMAAAMAGKGPGDLLWGNGVDYMLLPNSGKGWLDGAIKRLQAEDRKAVEAARGQGEPEPPVIPRVTAHDLRHTAASLAISAGANVKAVQRMLGHASAAMTLDTYADLFEDDLDMVSDALDAARRSAVTTL